MQSFDIHDRVIAKKNSKQLIKRGGRTIPISSDAYSRFETSAILQLKAQWDKVPIPPPYRIEYYFEMRGMGNTDADNMEASINDILQKTGIINNDVNILLRASVKLVGCNKYKATITVGQIDPLNLARRNWETERNRIDRKKKK